MEQKEILELIRLINKTNIAEFKLKKEEFEISIRTNQYLKNTGATQQMASPNLVSIPAPQMQPPIINQGQGVGSQDAVQPSSHIPDFSPAEEEKTEANYLEVKSPIVGTFYRSSGPDKPPFVKVGDVITKGDTVCIVEAMKLFNEIESEVSGKIVKVLIEDASPVQYDQVLFLVDSKG
jgi:acetyl-CoA carboxylase biotin carboxyl carrier protein